VQEVAFLWFLVGLEGVQMDHAKVEAITTWPILCMMFESSWGLQIFIGASSGTSVNLLYL